MGTKCLVAAAAMLLLIACVAHAITTTTQQDKTGSTPAVTDAARLVQQAFEDARHDNKAAAAELDAVLHAPGFAGLPEGVRYQTTLLAGLTA